MRILKNIDNQEKLPVFCQEGYLRSKSDNYGWFVEDNKILPFVIDKKLIFSRLIFTDKIYSKIIYSHKEEEEFLRKVICLARNLKIDFISKPQSNVFFRANILDMKNVASVKWGSYQKFVKNMSGDELINSFPSKTRNMVRKGKKENLSISPASIEELHIMLSNTFKRQKQEAFIPSLEFLRRLESNITGNFLLLKCEKGDEIQAVAGIPYDENVGYYLYGASVARPVAGAMNLLQFEVMKFLSDKGVEIYDFVGARLNTKKESKYYKIQKFKSSFNPELKEGYIFRVIYKPIKYKIFNFLVKVFYLLNGGKYQGDPIDQILNEGIDAK